MHYVDDKTFPYYTWWCDEGTTAHSGLDQTGILKSHSYQIYDLLVVSRNKYSRLCNEIADVNL